MLFGLWRMTLSLFIIALGFVMLSYKGNKSSCNDDDKDQLLGVWDSIFTAVHVFQKLASLLITSSVKLLRCEKV